MRVILRTLALYIISLVLKSPPWLMVFTSLRRSIPSISWNVFSWLIVNPTRLLLFPSRNYRTRIEHPFLILLNFNTYLAPISHLDTSRHRILSLIILLSLCQGLHIHISLRPNVFYTTSRALSILVLCFDALLDLPLSMVLLILTVLVVWMFIVLPAIFFFIDLILHLGA